MSETVNNNSVMRFARDLTIAAWESEFSRRGAPESRLSPSPTTGPDPGLAATAASTALHLDFTRVEFVDFGVLARALLVLDAAVRAGAPATVSLPVRAATHGEQAAIQRLMADGHPEAAAAQRRMKRRARWRGEARDFMRDAGFLSALAAPHWPDGAVRVLDSPTGPPDEQVDELHAGERQAGGAGPSDRVRLGRGRRVLPLRWVPPRGLNRLHHAHQFLALESGLQDLGLSRTDTHTIGKTILAELIENVARHAGAEPGEAPYALVGAMLVDADVYAERQPHPGAPDQLSDLLGHAAETNSRVLRIIVGDSGVGLTAGRGTGAEEHLLALIDEESHAADNPGGAAKADSRGLSLVSRIIDSYRGHISVRTRDLVGDLVFDGTRRQAGLVRARLAPMPGTLLEAVVLTGPRTSLLARAWEEHPAVNQHHTLHWMGCTLDARHGLASADRARLDLAARTDGAEQDAIGVVITVSVREALMHAGAAAIQETLRRAIGVIGRVTARTAAAIVFPDADRHLIDLCINSMHRADGAEEPGGPVPCPKRPVLVMGMSGCLEWCGGTAPVRAVLSALTAAGGILALDQALGHGTAADGGEHTTEELLEGVGHVAAVQDGNLILCLSPRQIMRALTDAVGDRLMDEITRDGHGVVCGRFRFPSLYIADRWIDSARLLADSVGFDVVAFAMARAVEAVMARLPPRRGVLAVALAAACPPELATRLSECLSLGGLHYPMASELDRDGWPAGGEVPDGARVVLCADVICTENTVRRAAAAIIRNAEPVAIVCIVDGRTERGPINVLNWEIPVIALAETLLDETALPNEGAPRADLPVIDIDPISRRPAPHPVPEPQLITEDEILEWCVADPGALRLGHIERQPHTHFSAYLRVDRLLRRAGIRSRIIDVFCEAVEQALARLDAGDHRGGPVIEVWHPGEPGDYAGKLAAAVRERLSARSHAVGPLVAVRRLVAGDRWQTVPVAPHREQGAHTVVIIDWGALTTRTLDQMILTAAACGARAVVAVVLLNQLAAHDPGLLGAISAVRRPAGSGEGGEVPDIPVVVRFLAQSSISELPLHNCAICATRAKYAEVGDLPARLRVHVERLRELLRPRNREEVFQTASTDLFNAPIRSQDIADYLRWRGLLQTALRDTRARQTVVDKLRALAADRPLDGWARSSLLRLLAAEQQWLKLSPLRFAVSWDLLAEICLAELRGPTAAPPWFRAQIVMVLSTAAPERFVHHLPTLLGLILDEPVAVDQMCVDCYRLLSRPLYDSPIVVSQMRDRLLRCRDELERLQNGSERKLIDDYLELFRDLIYAAEHPGSPRTGDAQAAWASLREDLCRPVIMHRFEAGALRVRDFLEDLREAPPSDEQMVAARSDWERCVRRLEELALPHLPELREILTGDYAADQLGKHRQGRLVRLARPDPAALRATIDWLFELLQLPWDPGDEAWSELRDRVLYEVNWWYHTFLATHLPDTGMPAHVVQLVQSVPVVLGDVVAEAIRTRSAGLEVVPSQSPDAGVRVYCPGPLLEEAVGHVLDNIRRHRSRGAVPRVHVGYRRPGPGTVVVILRNSGTRASAVPGHGLRSLAARLRPFGGFVRGAELAEGDWTFETAITLQLWQGA